MNHIPAVIVRDSSLSFKIALFTVLLVFVTTAPRNAAAQGGPLPDFVSQNGGNDVQTQVAGAIMEICPNLVNDVFGDLGAALAAAPSASRDLTLRCNELIQTAIDINTGTTGTPRGLRIAAGDLLSALQHVNGEELVTQGTMATRASHSQSSNLGARFNALRLGGALAGPATIASNSGYDSEQPVDLVYPTMLAGYTPRGGGASADSDAPFGRLGWFLTGSFSTGDRDATLLEDGFDFDSTSITAGVDYNFGNTVLGVSAGYDDYTADFDTTSLVSGGDVGADGMSFSVFGLVDFGSRAYITGAVTSGDLDYDISRNLVYTSNNMDPSCNCPNQSRALVATPEGDHLSGGLNGGLSFVNGAWITDLHLGVSYRDVDVDAYTETDQDPTNSGGMNLSIGAQDIQSLKSILGAQFSRNVNTDFGSMRTIARFDWHHEFDDEARSILAKYAVEDTLAMDATIPANPFVAGFGAGCQSCFTISTDNPEEDFFVVGLGLSFMFKNALQAFVFYEGMAGYEDLSSHSITLSLRGQF